MSIVIDTEPEAINWGAVEIFAKKLAKGTKATTDWDTGLSYFERLPGWKVHRQVLPMPLRGGIMDNNLEKLTKTRRDRAGNIIKPPLLPNIITNDDETRGHLRVDTAVSYELVVRGKKVKGLIIPMDYSWAVYDTSRVRNAPNVIIGTPTAETVKEGFVYLEQFDEVEGVSHGRTTPIKAVFVGQMWYGTRGATITAPSGASVAVFDEPKAPRDFGSDSFYTWGKKNGLYEDAKKHLEIFSEPLSPEEEDRIRLGGTLDETGVCAICEKRQKMHNIRELRPLLYQHGYQIPTWALREGWAPRSGVCFGAGLPPIELSPLAAAKYLDALEDNLVSLHASLANTKGLTSIKRREPVGKLDVTTGTRALEEVEYTPAHPKWAQVRESIIAEIEKAIRHVQRSIPVYAKRWKEWKRTDTFDEHKKGERFYTALMPTKPPDDEVIVASIVQKSF